MTPAEQLASGTLSLALVLDVFLKLGIVLILIYVSLRLLRRYAQQAPVAQAPNWLSQMLGGLSQSAPDQPLRTLQIHPLNRQVSLYLIEVDSRRLLLSVSQSDVKLLKEFSAPDFTSDLSSDLSSNPTLNPTSTLTTSIPNQVPEAGRSESEMTS